MKTINQESLDVVKAQLPEDKRDLVQQLVEAMNEAVNHIEGRPQTTKYWYGDYLPLINTKNDVLFYLLAGANKEGVAAIKQLKGL